MVLERVAVRLYLPLDRGGHVASEGRSLTGIAGVAGTGTQSFATDGLGRVTASSGISPSATYSYDLDGNRITKVDTQTTTDGYDVTDELSQQTIGTTTRAFTSWRRPCSSPQSDRRCPGPSTHLSSQRIAFCT